MGISLGEWNVLVDTVFPAANTAGAVALAVSYCKARHLDPFKRVVHIVPIYDKERKMWVETVWPGIAVHRTTAFRTREYAGHDEVAFGPEIERTWDDGDNGSVTIQFPEWAQMTVYRIVHGQRCGFPGPKVRWIETYAAKKSDAPNSMWADRPYGMIEKCAEAAALRGAFPEELGDEPSEVEASDRNWHGRPSIDVNAQTTAAMPRAEAVIPQINQETPISKVLEAVLATVREPGPVEAYVDSIDPPTLPEATQQPTEAATIDEADVDVLEGWKYDLEACETPIQCVEMRRGKLAAVPARLQPAVRKMIRDRQEALENQG
jgi:phage recombination protein Bet